MDDLKETVTKLLENIGCIRNSHSLQDYEAAKYWMSTLDLDPIQWHDACVIVAEYLGVKTS